MPPTEEQGAAITDLEAVVAVQDAEGLTGAAARAERKRRLEEKEAARLQRMSLAVASKRAVQSKKDQKRLEEEARLQRVAQKAAARRAAKEEGGKGADDEDDVAAVGEAAEDRATRLARKAAKRREERAAKEKEKEETRKEKRQRREGEEGAAKERNGEGRKERRSRKEKAEEGEDKAGDAKAGEGEEAKEEGAPAQGAGDSSDSDSSDSSSSSDSSPSAHGMAIAKALATGAPVPLSAPSKTPCFAWERPLQPSTACGLPTPQSAIFTGPPVVVPLASSTELEQFLSAGGVDGEAAVRLRALPPQLQRIVMDRGPVAGTRNPSSVVISRIKEVEALRLGAMPGMGGLNSGGPGVLGAASMVRSLVNSNPGGGGGGGGASQPNPEIEGLISKYSLDPQASNMLRRLSPDQQRMALRLPIADARNPSAYIMTQLSMPRLMGTGEASRLPTQPHDPTAMMISSMLRF